MALQIVQEFAGRVRLRQRAVIEADRISRLAAFRYLLGTGEGNARFIRLRRLRLRIRWGGVVCDRIRLRAGRAFVVLRVVLVSRLDADFVADIIGGELIARVLCTADFLPIAQPLIFDAGAVETVVVFDHRFQLAAHLRFAADADRASVVGLWLRVGVRIDQWVVRVVLHVQGEGLVVGAAVAVVGRHLQRDSFLGCKVEMFAVLQLECAIRGDFKAVIAHFVAVLVARIRVDGGQFAHRRAVFAFCHFAGGKLDVGRRSVGRGLRLHHSAFGIVAFFVAGVVGVLGFDADFMPFVVSGQGVDFAVRARNFLAVTQPLVADFAFVELVGVVDFGG